MNDMMIPVFQSEEALLCNARDLHEFLEVGRDFSTWFRNRIAQYGFIEGEDYITVEMMAGKGHKATHQNWRALESNTYEKSDFSPNLGESQDEEFDSSNLSNQTAATFDSPDLGNQKSGRGGDRRSIDYHLTIGMAKELAMIENNAMGRKVRRYFIHRERQAVALLKQQATEVQPLEQVRKRIKDTPKFRYLLILQEQSRTLARELARNEDPRERFNLHCALRQVNDAIGLPTEPLEVWNATHLPPAPPQIAST
ncbi:MULTISPECIES: antA/AntB antirepressor family protein [unclassified Halomonas]|uniref:antA/AntB antirepressor family protein n=1 Tax=unclassified Halomonas TaxID=2609666 RepID=UPI001EF5A5E2|nr:MULTISPECIES: antA/AntB antirepressor family protein [unclassified Halomonas]MCG7576795.1 antA/AntB antirepressor family protein [Halomonas sp. MMH1-48]MCG7603858.1 antA/AntB antirepressor family protein [Halomonas sp. MM17-34]MCG7613108.1 antA/AntB antirepressor family protein [Halomonas sp. MM17-29]MCG7619604.1 antA/AntB antirepressor family protein [Halomonas sp. DSH1-27]